MSLAISGTATPGGVLTIDTSGTAGLSVILIVGTAPDEACAYPFGSLFLSFASPWTILAWGQVPSSVQVAIPPSSPTPLPLVFQELALDALARGNTSNAVELTIR